MIGGCGGDEGYLWYQVTEVTFILACVIFTILIYCLSTFGIHFFQCPWNTLHLPRWKTDLITMRRITRCPTVVDLPTHRWGAGGTSSAHPECHFSPFVWINRWCEMMFWHTICTTVCRAPTSVCSGQDLIILTLGSGVLTTPCWLLQPVPPPKCQMLLCLLSDLICHLRSPWGPVSRNQTTAGLSTPSLAPGGLSHKLYGTSACLRCPHWAARSLNAECQR